jgi:hypothetical protein
MSDRGPGISPLHEATSYSYLFLSYAFLLAAGLSYAAYVTPLHVNDFLRHLFVFETQSVSEAFRKELFNATGGADWRPLQLPTAQLIYEFFARGQEHLVFKGMMVVSLFLTVALFVSLLQIRSRTDLPAAAIALLVLLGHQSFGGAVEGNYPYGVEIILLACEFAVLIILLRPRASVATEILAVAISVFAILLNEKGGFVGASYILGAALRLPGGTLRSAGLLFAAYVAILCYRFWIANPLRLMKRSEARNLWDGIVDAVAPIFNILISDPRVGQFTTIPFALKGVPWAILYLTSSVALTALIVVWAWSTSRRPEESERQKHKVAAIFVMVLVGSVIFGLFSRKDYVPIMALAGYALVSFYALKWFFAETLRAKRLAVYSVCVALAAGLALCWSIRAVGLVYYLRQVTFAYQFEWAFNIDLLARPHKYDASITEPIIARLRPAALSPPLNHPHLVFPRLITHFMRGRDCPEVCSLPASLN